MKESQIFFNSDGYKLFGMLYQPEIESERGYIICHPFGPEKYLAKPVFVQVARLLCHNGINVLLFDLRGYGDSEGKFSEACISDWKMDVISACNLLQSNYHISDIGFIGLRLGAFIGIEVAAKYSIFNHSLFIEPILNPIYDFNEVLRTKLFHELRKLGKIDANRKELIKRLEKNMNIDLNGYEITSYFYNDLLMHKEAPVSIKCTSVDLIQLSLNKVTSKMYQNYLKRCQDYNINTYYQLIKSFPFWKEFDLTDKSLLVNEIIDRCLSFNK